MGNNSSSQGDNEAIQTNDPLLDQQSSTEAQKNEDMDQKFTVSRHEYSNGESFLNWCCGVTEYCGASFTVLDTQLIMAAATKRTGGLTDFGGDGSWVERLDKILECASGPGPTPLAHVFLRELMVNRCANRLKQEAYLAKHPEIRQIPIKKPIFIVGLPRTGTTLLQNLMSLQEGRRSLKFWELTTPTPLDDDKMKCTTERTLVASRLLKAAYMMSPEMAEVHELTVDTPEECWHLFANTFAVLNLDLASGLRDYGDWLLDYKKMDQAYQEFKTQLQLLASQEDTDTYCLKCPEHLWFLDTLLEVFPDASIVWTHRDPVQTIASYCSMVSLGRRLVYGKYDPHDLGKHITSRFHEGIGRAMEVSAKHPDRFYHCDFNSLVRDPETVVKEICTKFGYAFSESDVHAAVEEYHNSNRKDKKGKHRYNKDLYGIDAKKIHGLYQDYVETFDIGTSTRRSSRASASEKKQEIQYVAPIEKRSEGLTKPPLQTI